METIRGLRVGVIGATSQIGGALVPRLLASGVMVYRIGRTAGPQGPDPVHAFDPVGGVFEPAIDSANVLISLAPLPAIGSVLDMARRLGVRRVIAFGSTGRFSKVSSPSALEQEFVREQAQAEQLLASRARADGVEWTLFRPTMIYGAGQDQSVAFVRAMVERFGFFPLPYGAAGLRQPVHVDDLAQACLTVLGNERTYGRAYNLGGGEVLPFPELVRRVARAATRRPILLPLPLTVYRLLIRVARRLPGASFVRMEMVDRMYRDLVADNEPAQVDFGYQPKGFFPGIDGV